MRWCLQGSRAASATSPYECVALLQSHGRRKKTGNPPLHRCSGPAALAAGPITGGPTAAPGSQGSVLAAALMDEAGAPAGGQAGCAASKKSLRAPPGVAAKGGARDAQSTVGGAKAVSGTTWVQLAASERGAPLPGDRLRWRNTSCRRGRALRRSGDGARTGGPAPLGAAQGPPPGFRGRTRGCPPATRHGSPCPGSFRTQRGPACRRCARRCKPVSVCTCVCSCKGRSASHPNAAVLVFIPQSLQHNKALNPIMPHQPRTALNMPSAAGYAARP